MEKHPTFRSLNKPLTVFGVERRLFFFVLTVALALFQVSGAFLPSLALFTVLVGVLRTTASYDPQLLRVLFNSGRLASRYDPAKWGDKKGGGQ